MQGAHQVAQKFTNKIFPLNSEKLLSSPRLFLKTKLEIFFSKLIFKINFCYDNVILRLLI